LKTIHALPHTPLMMPPRAKKMFVDAQQRDGAARSSRCAWPYRAAARYAMLRRLLRMSKTLFSPGRARQLAASRHAEAPECALYALLSTRKMPACSLFPIRAAVEFGD